MIEMIQNMRHDEKIRYRGIDMKNIDHNWWSEKYHAQGMFLACIACGKNVSKQGNCQGVMVGGGGVIIVHPDDYEKAIDGGDMGWFPVGSECIKKVPVEFRVGNPYEDKVRGV